MAKDSGKPYGGGTGYRGNGSREPQMLPDGYLQEIKQGYYTLDGTEEVLKREFIVDYPRKIARVLSNEGNMVNKRSQIRKFYEFALRIQTLMRRRDCSFAVVKPELARLVPFVTYAESRKTVSRNFRSFIEGNVDAVRSAEDMEAFVKHFECVIAFLPKDD